MGVHAGSSSHQLKSLEMVKHVIDIGVPEKLRLSERSIYKVPCNLRDVKKDAYTPYCISIGPIHLGTKELDTMQEHKLRYYQFFWDRVSNEEAMESYKHYLQNKEQEIRRCYSEKFTFPTEQFVDMMLLDAAFIMELFLRNCEAKSQSLPDSDDLIMKQSWLARDIARDLILLENQIPFFVLLELYEKVVPDYQRKKEHTGFVDLAFEYFAFYDPQMWPFSNNQETKKGNFCCSKEPCKPKSKECLFRNLIAFEQCHYPDETNYICNYVSLIDSLIHTQLDVELLVEKEVIVHELGSHKEVASLVNETFGEQVPLLSGLLCSFLLSSNSYELFVLSSKLFELTNHFST
ncbi:UPF0481 protein [Vigna angularis]|uniref:UPF0481 protein n=1 Tax=Phaseolus angularis TaxID=3914 RepID=A0A8T0JVH8_PHAAN|nr:UPF0481 protein [Vigna angularis]